MAWGFNAATAERPQAGSLRHKVSLANPDGDPVPDGDGGYTQPYAALDPEDVWASIEPASVRKLERVSAGTVISAASHIVTLRFHSGVTTKTRITFGSRIFYVTGVMNPDERNLTTMVLCTENVG